MARIENLMKKGACISFVAATNYYLVQNLRWILRNSAFVAPKHESMNSDCHHNSQALLINFSSFQHSNRKTTTIMSMHVVKRDGRTESVHFDKITSRISKLAFGLDTKVSQKERKPRVTEMRIGKDPLRRSLSPLHYVSFYSYLLNNHRFYPMCAIACGASPCGAKSNSRSVPRCYDHGT